MAKKPATTLIIRKMPAAHMRLLAAAAEREGYGREKLIREILADWIERNTVPA